MFGNVRRLMPLLPLPLVLALGAFGSARLADHLGGALGSLLSGVASLLAQDPPDADAGAELDALPVASPVLGTVDAAPPPAEPARKGKARKVTPAVFVSADAVLRIASTRQRLRGVPVGQDGARPPGLELHGVSALGVGLRDGDVLTRALGQPALSRAQIVRAVLLARARREKVLSGEFYRGRERWVLRVEQPYLEAPAAMNGPEAAAAGARVASR